MMTKKDYELIANVFAEYHAPLGLGQITSSLVVEELAHALADALADDNPRFDLARFLKACRVAP
jgi:hypothetical protein